ncbi:MAG TPA: hypothetical protein P5320_07435 [Bacteroidales bacterium]|nr:hypothetical protein [Bacteroidales bacterium]HOK74732.1 hypothetical protein [Bacteroidales bacterium]HOM41008.1 hypothetical protein [Bacteroidales bacterium]HOU30663.1 hypothetical protein [Bacteroidales bacterium]HPP92619.1 hypothetical protein [Bacteroidales bacterium]
MKSKVLMGFAAIVMVALMSACGKLPQAQIDEANAAIEAAKAAEAEVYVPADFAALQDSMRAVNAYIESQKSKLFKKYGPAVEDLKAVVTLANTVKENAAARKDEVKKEVETLMTDIKAVIDETSKLFAKAPKGKEGKAALDQMKAEMETVNAAVTEAQSKYDSGAYMDALNKVKAAKETVDRINGELKEAIKKAGGRI